MANAKHTPGPWELLGLDIVSDPGVIATTPTPQRGGVFDREGNARLIAAAPELLEALKALHEDYALHEGCYCGQLVGGCKKDGEPLHVCGFCLSDAAIAKAEGKNA